MSTPDSEMPSGGAPAPRHRLGVLFVHGIGEQPEGSTLLQFGQPLIDWLRAWLARPSPRAASGSLEVVDATLSQPDPGGDEPAHATVRLRLEQDGRPHEEAWLIAESWWAGGVQPPPVNRLVGWMLTIGTWTILSHATKLARGFEHRAVRLAVEALAVAGALVAAALFQLAIVLVALLAVLPIPGVRRAVSGALLTLTGVLGDSYVLVESDIQRAAIVRQARRALGWLAERCDEVVVVGHSQGAAVAHHALREPEPANVPLLVTFGSGLGKLEELLDARAGAGYVRAVGLAGPLLVVLGALVIRLTRFEQAEGLGELALWLVGAMLLFLVMWIFVTARDHWQRVDRRAAGLSLAAVRPGVAWLDLYASHDPVSNGALPNAAGIVGLRSERVVNLRSVMADHTGYWRNRSEFVARVVREIDGRTGGRLVGPAEAAALDAAAARHRRRVGWWSATGWATALSVALLFWQHASALRATGEAIGRRLQTAEHWLDGLLSGAAGVASFVFSLAFGAAAADVGFVLLGAALPLAAIGAWRFGFRFLWRWWDDRSLSGAMASRPAHPADRVILDAAVLGLGFAPLLIVPLWPLLAGLRIGALVGGGWLALFALMIVLAGYQLLRQLPGAWRARRTHDAPIPKAVRDHAIGIAFMVLLFAFLLIMFLPVPPALKGVAPLALAFVMVSTFVHRATTGLVSRVQERTARGIAVALARWGPGLVTAVGLLLMLYGRGGWRPVVVDAAGIGWSESAVSLLIIVLGLYSLALMAAYGVLHLAERRRARSARTHPGP